MYNCILLGRLWGNLKIPILRQTGFHLVDFLFNFLGNKERFSCLVSFSHMLSLLYPLLGVGEPLWGGDLLPAGTERGPGQGEDPLHPLHLLHHLLVAALRRDSLQLELELGVRQELHSSCCEYLVYLLTISGVPDLNNPPSLTFTLYSHHFSWQGPNSSPDLNKIWNSCFNSHWMMSPCHM